MISLKSCDVCGLRNFMQSRNAWFGLFWSAANFPLQTWHKQFVVSLAIICTRHGAGNMPDNCVSNFCRNIIENVPVFGSWMFPGCFWMGGNWKKELLITCTSSTQKPRRSWSFELQFPIPFYPRMPFQRLLSLHTLVLKWLKMTSLSWIVTAWVIRLNRLLKMAFSAYSDVMVGAYTENKVGGLFWTRGMQTVISRSLMAVGTIFFSSRSLDFMAKPTLYVHVYSAIFSFKKME